MGIPTHQLLNCCNDASVSFCLEFVSPYARLRCFICMDYLMHVDGFEWPSSTPVALATSSPSLNQRFARIQVGKFVHAFEAGGCRNLKTYPREPRPWKTYPRGPRPRDKGCSR